MITTHLLDGIFSETQKSNLGDVVNSIETHRHTLRIVELDVIIALLDAIGKKIMRDETLRSLPGVGYLALWLKKDNLRRMCSLNYFDGRYYETFTPIDGGVELRMQPRGVVSHWVADNVPTLAFFSVVQAFLSKNGSMVKVSDINRDILTNILKALQTIEIVHGGTTYSGSDLVKTVSLLSFSSGDYEANKQFSLSADCKVVWGSSDALRAILALPQKEHCETIVFGPKYSFGVFDKAYIESSHFEKTLFNAVQDVAVFNQMACSSPHVFFFEKSACSLQTIAQMMQNAFENLPPTLRGQNMSRGIAARIINERGRYLLDSETDILKSDDLSWTILINHKVALEDPIQGRCVFIKEVDTIESIPCLITRKIQAVSTAILDDTKRKWFADEVTYRGVDRVMPPGKMHHFDLPWDGILALNRLVRWVVLKKE